MDFNDAMVSELADLARLHFNDQQKSEIKKDLQRMIQFVDKLNVLDTKGVVPLLHMSENVNVLRDDIVMGCISREKGLKNATVHNEKFFNAPKVIRK